MSSYKDAVKEVSSISGEIISIIQVPVCKHIFPVSVCSFTRSPKQEIFFQILDASVKDQESKSQSILVCPKSGCVCVLNGVQR